MTKVLVIVFNVLFLIAGTLLVIFDVSDGISSILAILLSVMTVSAIGGMVYKARMKKEGQNLPPWFHVGNLALNSVLFILIFLRFAFHVFWAGNRFPPEPIFLFHDYKIINYIISTAVDKT